MDAQETQEFALGNPLILRAVLSHLGWRDLDSCRRTSKEWASAVDSLLAASGSEPQAYVLYENEDGEGEHRLRVTGVLRRAPELRLVFVRNALPHHVRNSWLRRVVKCRDGDTQKPMMLFVFARNAFGAVDSFSEGKALVSGLSIPPINGVDIYPFKFDQNNDDFIKNDFVRRNNPKLVKMAEQNYVKCVLAFTKFLAPCDSHFQNTLLTFLLSRQRTEPRHFALGGGSVDRTKIEGLVGDRSNQRGTIHLIFCIPKSLKSTSHFEAYSGVLWTDGQTEARLAIESKIEKMSQSIKLLQHSVALLFACHDQSEFVVKLFQKYFPATPVVGCQTTTGIGIDNFETVNNLPLGAQNRRYKYVESTCTLVILTWNYLKSDSNLTPV